MSKVGKIHKNTEQNVEKYIKTMLQYVFGVLALWYKNVVEGRFWRKKII